MSRAAKPKKSKSVSFADEPPSTKTASLSLESVSDDVDDFDPDKETLLMRLYALKDIVPVHRRRRFWDWTSTVAFYVTGAYGLASVLAWGLTTSALLVAIPLGIELEREQMLLAMENEQKLQQQAAQQMLQPNVGLSPLLPPTMPMPPAK